MKRTAPSLAPDGDAPATAKASHYFSPNPAGLENVKERQLELRIAGHSLQVSTGDGVFSKSQLDAGTALLLETFIAGARVDAGSRLLDLGCGWGAVGCLLGKHYPDSSIAMCDINLRAALLAQRNAVQNDLANAVAWCGDGAGAARRASFDFILCNPPVRAGNEVIARLFEDALTCAKNGGELWVVLRTAQGAKSWQRRLNESWGNCDTLAIDHGYRILRSVKHTI